VPGGKFPHCQKAVRGALEDCDSHYSGAVALCFCAVAFKATSWQQAVASEKKNFEMAIFRQTVDARISQTHMGGFVIRREES